MDVNQYIDGYVPCNARGTNDIGLCVRHERAILPRHGVLIQAYDCR